MIHLILQSLHILRETDNQLELALQGQLTCCAAVDLFPLIVYVDPALGFQVIVNHFPRAIIDVGGAQDNNAKVDIKIRMIKELSRCIKGNLPWQLLKTQVKDLHMGWQG